MSNTLEKYRREKSLTYQKLADICRLSKGGVYLHCHDRRRISAEAAIRYAERLGIPLSLIRPDLWAENVRQA